MRDHDADAAALLNLYASILDAMTAALDEIHHPGAWRNKHRTGPDLSDVIETLLDRAAAT